MLTSYRKYTPYKSIALPRRKWPERRLDKAPDWCSVDLRDGNQALVEPMNAREKLEFFKALVSMGFKQIEIGFPSSSQIEYDFARELIKGGHIPSDVYVQVLAPAREQLIRRTFEAVEGAENVIMHLYNNTSPFFRQIVYHTDLAGVTDMAVRAARLMVELARDRDGKTTFEYSPEGFQATEPNSAVYVCSKVLDAFDATEENKLILNLPATVESLPSNAFADLVEYFIHRLDAGNRAVISVHPHNDRGTGVATAEMALLAGATRVEGTLFGNGERTGNCDLITLALNLYTQGVDPRLDFSSFNEVKRLYERLTHMHISPRQPYAGELVFTAFSGSHQDAIKKGFDYLREHDMPMWTMPYLPIDPRDLGGSYEPIIRINSQSGKGGVAYVMQSRFGYNIPTSMRPDFGRVIKREADRLEAELTPEQILRLFLSEYCDVESPYRLIAHDILERGEAGHSVVRFTGTIAYRNRVYSLEGEGNGPIDAFFQAMRDAHIDGFEFRGYHEHAIGEGSNARAVAYIELKYRGESYFGIGMESNVSIASIKGVISAINRALREEDQRG
ncbi:MAG: 2-isopropylmalate synthase [Clostridia bacterium]|nr:2-isopropylmalate synthase [Clostridia bacterium]